MKNNNHVENEDADETVVDMPDPTVEAPAPAIEPTTAPVVNEADQLKDRLLRLQADFDNYRKRSVRERAEWQVFATKQLVEELLPVIDHYELGIATAEKSNTDPAVLGGFKLVYEQLLGVLKKQGVTPVTVAPGTPFDPHQHEAISHVPSEEHAADIVIAETRRGYKLGDKMIRPLQVVVSSGSAQTKGGT